MLVEWTEQALLNLDLAIEFIAKDNQIAAAKTAQRIWTATQALRDQPGLGRPGRVDGTRELVIHDLPYILPYVIQSERVIILRVIHAAMKWPKNF